MSISSAPWGSALATTISYAYILMLGSEGLTKSTNVAILNANYIKNRLEDKFDILWREAGISGLKGHRSVGGYRASIYNALPIESIEVLINVMSNLENN